MRAATRTPGAVVVGALVALGAYGPTAAAGEPAPVPGDYEPPRSTVEVYTAWEAPRSSVSFFYTDPEDVGTEELEEALDAEDEGEQTVVQLSDQFLFDFGSAQLRPTATRSLDTVVAVLEEGEAPVEVTGHTDPVGGDAVNQPLSQDRARAVADYLVEQGIAESRITAEGRGSSEPVAPNTHEDGRDDPEGRQQNRRVEIRYSEGS
ncbi:OmpA family protein [uncultured Serinicoccus sp.]|uniref:OmpA family protein n=1 Tax=uncultured Serinicoccus sp. TaxID=735514 RepID=UPI00260FCBFF|nr:OmpA family protein [uncultured Serinicoccus sp.]